MFSEIRSIWVLKPKRKKNMLFIASCKATAYLIYTYTILHVSQVTLKTPDFFLLSTIPLPLKILESKVLLVLKATFTSVDLKIVWYFSDKLPTWVMFALCLLIGCEGAVGTLGVAGYKWRYPINYLELWCSLNVI